LSLSAGGNVCSVNWIYQELHRRIPLCDYIAQLKHNIVKVTDNVNDTTTYYTYDLADRLLNFRESTGRYVTYEYDENNNATSLKEVIDGITYTTSFSYNQDNTLKSITINSGASFEYYFDEKGLPNRAITTLNSGYKLYTQYIYNQRGLLQTTNMTRKPTPMSLM